MTRQNTPFNNIAEEDLYAFVDNAPLQMGDLLGLDHLNFHDPDDYFSLISDRRGTPNDAYTIGAHGNSTHIADDRTGYRRMWTPFELAWKIRHDLRYAPHNPVRLYACETGKGNHSFAQRLSNILCATVIAPTTTITYLWNEPFQFILWSYPVMWKTFRPGGS